MARISSVQHLTKALIDRLKYEGNGTNRDVVWDDEVRRLGIRIYPTGRKAFVLSYRAGRRQKFLTIGAYGPLTAAQARKAATVYKGEVIAGNDPLSERKAASGQRTVKNLCAKYLKEAKASNRNENSYKIDERNIRNHIIPRIGGLSVADVQTEDVFVLYRAVRDGKTARPRPATQLGGAAVTGGTVVANRVAALSSSLFGYAESLRWRPVGSNPARGIKRTKEVARERFLSDQELAGLGDAIYKAEADGESVYAIAAISLLIFTGARLREILNLEWEWVDLDRALLNLPQSKTGKKIIHLPPPALSILACLPWQATGEPS
jgi:site-specific recombinase XerD